MPTDTQNLVTRKIALRADSLDEKTRSVGVTLTTSNVAQVFDFRTFEIIDEIIVVSGVQFGDSIPLCQDHDNTSIDHVLGHVREMSVNGEEIIGRMMFDEPADSDDRAPLLAWNKVRQRSVRNVSIGYDVADGDFVDISPGSTEEVDGVEYTAESRTLRITKRSTLRELSLVVVGADEAAKLRSKEMSKRTSDEMEAKEGADEEEKKRQDEEDEEKRQAEEDEEKRQAEEDEEKKRQDEEDEERDDHGEEDERSSTSNQSARAGEKPMSAREAVKVERKRVKAIRGMAADGNIPADMVDKAIDGEWSESRTSKRFYQHVIGERSESVGVNIITPHRDKQQLLSALAGGLAARSGKSLVPKSLPETDPRHAERKTMIEHAARAMEMGRQYADMSMIERCREVITLSGGIVPRSNKEVFERALSTADMVNIFSQNVSMVVLNTYEEAPDSTNGWVKEQDVLDFKTNERPLPSPMSHLRRLPRGGEAEHLTATDTVEVYKVNRFAGQFVYDEQDAIDDRMDVLNDKPRDLAMAAARVRPDSVYALLLENATLGADSIALFDTSTHANLITTALSAASVQTAIESMAKQTYTVDEGVVNLNLRPKYWIGPQDLSFDINIILNSAQRIIASASGGTLNPLQEEMIETRVDNRLGVAGVTDPASGTAFTGTATNWFMMAEPVRGNTIEVGYIQGSGRVPRVRTFVLDEGKFGIGVDVSHDIGVKALDFRGVFKSTGAA
jgi:hypothetical protein